MLSRSTLKTPSFFTDTFFATMHRMSFFKTAVASFRFHFYTRLWRENTKYSSIFVPKIEISQTFISSSWHNIRRVKLQSLKFEVDESNTSRFSGYEAHKMFSKVSRLWREDSEADKIFRLCHSRMFSKVFRLWRVTSFGSWQGLQVMPLPDVCFPRCTGYGKSTNKSRCLHRGDRRATWLSQIYVKNVRINELIPTNISYIFTIAQQP